MSSSIEAPVQPVLASPSVERPLLVKNLHLNLHLNLGRQAAWYGASDE